MSKLNKFWDDLNKYRKKPDSEFSEYGDNRVTWCHLLTKHNGELHRFEVRGATYWGDVQEQSCDVICISVVNWTLSAGTGSLSLTENNVGKFLIEEDEPTVGLLYVE